MRAELNQIDTAAAGVNIVDVQDWSPVQDFAVFEREAILPLQPSVAFCKVPAEATGSIHVLGRHGFHFAEFQFTLRHRIREALDVKSYPFRWERVTTSVDLNAALELAGTIFEHDRFSTDPQFGPAVSGRRYRAYVEKSYRDPDERVYVMKRDGTDKVVSFGTLRQLSAWEVRLLIGGVASDLKQSGMGAIHDYVGLQTYYEEGIRVLHTVVSGVNYSILNLEIAHLGFRVQCSHAVLRKRYA